MIGCSYLREHIGCFLGSNYFFHKIRVEAVLCLKLLQSLELANSIRKAFNGDD